MLDTGEKNMGFGRWTGLGIQRCCGHRKVTSLSLGFLPMRIVVRGVMTTMMMMMMIRITVTANIY